MRILTTLLLAAAPLIYAEIQDENSEIAAIDSPVVAGQALEPPIIESPKPEIKIKSKSSFWAVGLSMLYPGAGHMYLGEYQKAAGLAGTTAASYSSYEETNGKTKQVSGVIFQNTWFYSSYAAYRDVRNFNEQRGYKYPMPQDSLEDLIKAPFQWSVVSKKEVWGGILGFLTAGAVVSYYAFPETAIHFPLATQDNPSMPPIMAFPVGIGEESFFRGFLQSTLMEYTSPIPAIFGSSLCFGLVHIPNAEHLPENQRKVYYTAAVPLITVFGGYMGWLTHKTGSLKYSTAIHSWYDFIVFSAAASAKKDSKTKAALGRHSFSYSISY